MQLSRCNRLGFVALPLATTHIIRLCPAWRKRCDGPPQFTHNCEGGVYFRIVSKRYHGTDCSEQIPGQSYFLVFDFDRFLSFSNSTSNLFFRFWFRYIPILAPLQSKFQVKFQILISAKANYTSYSLDFAFSLWYNREKKRKEKNEA